jgi:hypothetical protein
VLKRESGGAASLARINHREKWFVKSGSRFFLVIKNGRGLEAWPNEFEKNQLKNEWRRLRRSEFDACDGVAATMGRKKKKRV